MKKRLIFDFILMLSVASALVLVSCSGNKEAENTTAENTEITTPYETANPGTDGEGTAETPDLTDDTNTPTPAPTTAVTPGETPDITPSETPDITPGETPSATPSATPTPTPVVIPAETPDETPTVIPDTTPTAAPSTTPAVSVNDGVTVIVCSGSSATIEGGGASLTGNIISITAAGEYELSGNFKGQLTVNVPQTDKVKLVLKGFTIEYSADSPIYVISADKVTIKNQNGYINYVKDTDATVESDSDTRGKAAIYAKSSLEFSGAGIMYVTADYKHGISCTKKLTISGGNITVNAEDCALKGNNSVVIEGGTLNLTSKGDAIKNEDEDDTEHGFITILNGNITINTESDGIASVRTLTISGGTINITTTGNDTGSASSGGGGRPGRPGGGGWFGGGTTVTTTDISSKGIKAGCDSVATAAALTITGGTITINSTGHSLHCTGNVNISGSASLDLTSSQKGVQAHGTLTVDGGEINIKTSTEGLESKGNMYLSGGNITLYATDDGLNAGNRGSIIYISGGVVDITTKSGDTDGIDSNGSLVVSGGFVLVKGGSSSGNVAGSIDVDGSITVSGGTVVALGGICELPDSQSSAYTVRLSSTTFPAGEYKITDKDGNTLVEFTLESSYSKGWISSDKFVSGGQYTLSRGSTTVKSWTQSSKTVS